MKQILIFFMFLSLHILVCEGSIRKYKECLFNLAKLDDGLGKNMAILNPSWAFVETNRFVQTYWDYYNRGLINGERGKNIS